ncbi:MAG: hypothetical protein KF723_22785 [Rhizobiaceae bacterium]|nr:hypothetical protein [Rhizobiaceae bacterium]
MTLSVNRRAVVRALAAISATGCAATLPAVAAEEPIVELGRQLQAARQRFADAMSARAAALARWHETRPAVPDALLGETCPLNAWGFTDNECDPFGALIIPTGSERPRQIVSSYRVKRQIRNGAGHPWLFEVLPIAESYERARDEAIDQVLDPHHWNAVDAGRAVDEIATRILETDSDTVAGVAAKARALLAFDDVAVIDHRMKLDKRTLMLAHAVAALEAGKAVS